MVTDQSIKVMLSRQRHLDKNLKRELDYRIKNRDMLAEKTKQWRTDNPEKYKDQYNRATLRKQTDGAYRLDQNDKTQQRATNDKLALFDYLGNKCVKCGYAVNTLALEIGHVHDDGVADRKRFNSCSRMYKYYINNKDEIPDKIELVCCNCNRIQEMIRRMKARRIKITTL